jgi:hypothetical protein
MALEYAISSEEPRLTFSVRWDDARYTVDLRWNTRAEFWSMALLSDTNDLVMGHQRVTLRVDMLRSHVDESLPPGAIVWVDTDGSGTEPGRYDLSNGRVKLIYLTEQEVSDAS